MRNTVVLNKTSKDIKEDILWLDTLEKSVVQLLKLFLILEGTWLSTEKCPHTPFPVHLLVCLRGQRYSLECWGVSADLACSDKSVPLSGGSLGGCIWLVASSSQ